LFGFDIMALRTRLGKGVRIMVRERWRHAITHMVALGLVVGWFVADSARAQAPEAKKSPADEKAIRALIMQLADEAYEKREAGQKRLAEIGEPALAALRKALGESRDAELRLRAQKVIEEIEQRVFLVALKEQQWGSLLDPDKDCVFRAAGGKMHIRIPATAHRLAFEGRSMNAPRVLRPIEGDFHAEVKIEGPFPDARSLAADPPRVGAGLLAWQDEKNYIRYERTRASFEPDKWTCYVNWEFRRDGKLARMGVWEDGLLDGDKPALFRLVRKGKTFTASYSQDGKKWHELPLVHTSYGTKLLIGVTAVQNTAAGYEAIFEGLKVTPARQAAGQGGQTPGSGTPSPK
jgi:regulation of enolase protein 1 (concanavalin A-like superfamily)